MQTQAVETTSPSSNSSSQEQIRKTAKEFEAIFSSIMLKAMRNTVGENALIPSSFGEEMYTGMLDNEYSKLLGGRGTLGLAGMIERELERRGGTGNALQDLIRLKETPGPAAITSSQARMDPAAATPSVSRWHDLIEQASREHGVDSSLLAAVITQESGGNPSAVSPKGAKGLMQLMPGTAAELGVRSPLSPRENIAGGAKYLRALLDRFDGNERLALASYNAGPGAVEKYGSVPPYSETRHYVDSVLQIRNSIQNNRSQIPFPAPKENL